MKRPVDEALEALATASAVVPLDLFAFDALDCDTLTHVSDAEFARLERARAASRTVSVREALAAISDALARLVAPPDP